MLNDLTNYKMKMIRGPDWIHIKRKPERIAPWHKNFNFFKPEL